MLGSVAYVRQHLLELEKLDVVLVTDSGSEAAKGWMVMDREDEKTSVEALNRYSPDSAPTESRRILSMHFNQIMHPSSSWVYR